jgi:hypothetical protein
MKILKNVSFLLVILFFILHVIIEFIIMIENGGVLSYTAYILKEYEMLIQYVTVPVVLVYLYKRLK